MSEADQQATSILLPGASVTIFSKDPDTLTAARDIDNDWRFARVRLQVEQGDIGAAINAYSEMGSPDLVIVQTDTIDDTLTAQLESLAGHLSEGTAAIVIGPVNDVYLYRKLIEMGVSDYLVRPVSAKVLAEVIAKTLIDRLGVTGSRLIAFIGSKGGVGTSALAQAAAWCAADTLGQKTLLLDCSGGWSAMSVGLGFEPSTTLAEAGRAAEAANEDSLMRMMFKASDRLTVLASGGEVMLEPALDAAHLETLIDTLMVKYPVIVADLSHTEPGLAKAVVARANRIVAVTTPLLPALRLARSLIHEIKDVRGGRHDEVDLIVNMQGAGAGFEVSKSDIETAMEFKISSIVPNMPKIFLGTESRGKKLSDDKEGELIVRLSLQPILQKTLAVDAPEAPVDTTSDGLLGGFLKKIKTK